MDERNPPEADLATIADEADPAFDAWLREGDEAIERGDFVTHGGLATRLRARWGKDTHA